MGQLAVPTIFSRNFPGILFLLKADGVCQLSEALRQRRSPAAIARARRR